MKRKIFNKLVAERDFRRLFTEHLGWETPKESSRHVHISTPDVNLDYECVAERGGVPVLVAELDCLPTAFDIRLVDSLLRRNFIDYITIYIQAGNVDHQMWTIPAGRNGTRELVSYEYGTPTEADNVFGRIDTINFSSTDLTTNDAINGSYIRKSINRAFEINRIKMAKEFYNELCKQQEYMADSITGIDDDKPVSDNACKQSYSWLMISRLILCYYIQKVGIIDDNTHYLHDKLDWHVNTKAKNQCHATFYRVFLCRLFDVLSCPGDNREFEAQLGRVPHIDAYIFHKHSIERLYAYIDIADEAIVSLFDFLDSWHWHTMTHVTGSGHDITPDIIDYVLVHSFNEFATDECEIPVTENIEPTVRNTVISHVLTRVSRMSATMREMFQPDGYIWQMLRTKGERYVLDNSYADDTLNKVKNGQISTIRDLSVNGIDSLLFVRDLIMNTDSEALVNHLYDTIRSTTILDPNCGNGSYLIASYDTLEPLYCDCLLKLKVLAQNRQLQGTSDDIYKSRIHNATNTDLYSLSKAILANNIYGIDINGTAIELCKLRLLVKQIAISNYGNTGKILAALPEPELNVRCGNMLVGYIGEKDIKQDLTTATDIFQDLANKEFRGRVVTNLLKVSAIYRTLKIKTLLQSKQNTELQNTEISDVQIDLMHRLTNLNDLLNRFIFVSTGYLSTEYYDWCESQLPFNWITEYYEVMHDKRGFDIIIGNSLKGEYNRRDSKPGKAMYGVTKNLLPQDCGNLYTLMMSRCQSLSAPDGLINIKKVQVRKLRK